MNLQYRSWIEEVGGTVLMLLANPDSHFSPQKPINIMGDRSSIQHSARIAPELKTEN